jgi:hypothetical protein
MILASRPADSHGGKHPLMKESPTAASASMSAKSAKRKSDTLAQQFELEDAFLSSPNSAALKFAVIRAVDRATADPVVLKYWEKTGTEVDSDFRELWRHEMRQSERVRAFPRGWGRFFDTRGGD